jgi:hypothetical protein
MSTEGHKAAMQADYSPTLDESIDPPPYSPDDMNGYVFLAIVVLCLLSLAVALSPAFWSLV